MAGLCSRAVFANAIHAKEAPLHQCWGFIDGTARPIARPIRNQKNYVQWPQKNSLLKVPSEEGLSIQFCYNYVVSVYISNNYVHLF